MIKKIFNSPRSVREIQHHRFVEIRKKVRASVRTDGLSDDQKSLILALAGIDGYPERLLASDTEAIKRASRFFAEAMASHRARDPKLKLFLLTFMDDVGIVSDRSPIAPLATLEAKVRRQLAKLNLDAVAVIEVHPLMNYPGGGEGRSLLYHVHVLAWTTQPFDHNAAAANLNASHAWNCKLGAPPVIIEPVGDSELDVRRTAAYMIKPPHSAKNRMASKTDPARFLLMDTIEGYRPELALRVIEGLSQIEFCSLVFGIGTGRKIRQQLRAEIDAWHRQRPRTGTIVPSATDVWQFWLQLRQQFGSKNFLPYRFDSVTVPKPPRAAPKARARINRSRPKKAVRRKSRWQLSSSPRSRRTKKPDQRLL